MWTGARSWTDTSQEVTAARPSPSVALVTRYRFLDGMGDIVADSEFPDHGAALAWARDDTENDEDVQRVEFLGPEGDWRWAGPLLD
jgi:hypothetical protein